MCFKGGPPPLFTFPFQKILEPARDGFDTSDFGFRGYSTSSTTWPKQFLFKIDSEKSKNVDLEKPTILYINL